LNAQKIKRLKAIAVALLIAGTAIMVPWEHTLTLLLGCAMLILGIVCAWFVVAEPGFLTADGDTAPTRTPETQCQQHPTRQD
jgi:hypothetical protein